MAMIVFYNTLCPVCKAGITQYERAMIALVKSGAVEYRDINLEPDRFAAQGVTIEHIRKKLHALKDGQLIIGADVAIEIWKLMPGRKWLGQFLGLPPMRQFARLGYHLLAQLLYVWNRHKGNW